MSPAKPSVIGADAADTDAVADFGADAADTDVVADFGADAADTDAVADLAAGAETAVPAAAVTDDNDISTATASIAAVKRREDLRVFIKVSLRADI